MIVNDIQDFSELTDFIQNEYVKLSEEFGIKKASDSMLSFIEKALKKYFVLYDKPLYRMAKRELKLKEAIDTMPHGKLWKFFHSGLQAKIEARLAAMKDEENLNHEDTSANQVVETLPAVIIKQQGLPQVSDI